MEDGGCLCNNSCECAAVCDKCSNNDNQSGRRLCECNDKCECIIPTSRTLAALWWNDVINEVVKQDYSGLPGRQPDQEGPTGTSRALAMVHVAMYDAYAGWTGDGPTYLNFGQDLPAVRGSLRLRRRQGRAAIAAAAFTAMSALYPNNVNSAFLEARRDEFAATLPNGRGYLAAAAFGVLAAERMLEDREGDGSEVGSEFRAGEPVIFPEMHVVVRFPLRAPASTARFSCRCRRRAQVTVSNILISRIRSPHAHVACAPVRSARCSRHSTVAFAAGHVATAAVACGRPPASL